MRLLQTQNKMRTKDPVTHAFLSWVAGASEGPHLPAVLEEADVHPEGVPEDAVEALARGADRRGVDDRHQVHENHRFLIFFDKKTFFNANH